MFCIPHLDRFFVGRLEKPRGGLLAEAVLPALASLSMASLFMASLLLVLPFTAPANAGSITRLEANGHGHVLSAGKTGGMREMRAGVRYHGPGKGHDGRMQRKSGNMVIMADDGGTLAVSGRSHDRRSGLRSGREDRREYRRGHDRRPKAGDHRARHATTASGHRRGLYAGNRHGGAAIGWSNSGLIVVTVNNGVHNGMSEIAGGNGSAGGSAGGGGSAGLQDCEYGSYCSIDLGGPKIITFNDIGTIRDGELVEEGEESYGK